MSSLTIVIPNKDRMDINSNSTKWLLKSLQWQVCDKPFDILFADGGSANYEELKNFVESYNGKYPMKFVQKKIDVWNKSLLNNFGIRSAKGEYILRTDADILFAQNFVSSVVAVLDKNAFIEARTMYWKGFMSNKIYSGELDPYANIDACKIGRIKKRTTCGGCQCTHIDNWTKLKGYNEDVAWIYEDMEMMVRASVSGLNIKWIGENINNIMLFHQPHECYKNTTEQLAKVGSNKYLSHHPKLDVNTNGWGGMP